MNNKPSIFSMVEYLIDEVRNYDALVGLDEPDACLERASHQMAMDSILDSIVDAVENDCFLKDYKGDVFSMIKTALASIGERGYFAQYTRGLEDEVGSWKIERFRSFNL